MMDVREHFPQRGQDLYKQIANWKPLRPCQPSQTWWPTTNYWNQTKMLWSLTCSTERKWWIYGISYTDFYFSYHLDVANWHHIFLISVSLSFTVFGQHCPFAGLLQGQNWDFANAINVTRSVKVMITKYWWITNPLCQKPGWTQRDGESRAF